MHVDRETSGAIALPETVQALIAARLDTLGRAEGLLHDASVLGKVFWTGALVAMGDRSREKALDGLRELVRREFVRPARVSSMRDEEEFSFWHVLVRDVAYHQIPRAARAAKHVSAASGSRLPPQTGPRITRRSSFTTTSRRSSCERGGRRSRLATRAATRAVPDPRRGPGDATRHDCGGGVVSASALALGRQRRSARRPRQARRHAERARSPAGGRASLRGCGGGASRGRRFFRGRRGMRLRLARALWRHGQTSRARQLIYEAIAILEHDRSLDLLLAYERAALVDTIGGRSQEGLRWSEKGLALGRELGVENVVRHLQFHGLARVDLGDASGLDDQREALELSLRLGLGIETATSYLNLGESIAPFEPLSSSLELTEASLEFARRRGLRHHEMWTRSSRLWLLYDLGEWDALRGGGRASRLGPERRRRYPDRGQRADDCRSSCWPNAETSMRQSGMRRSFSLRRARSEIRRCSVRHSSSERSSMRSGASSMRRRPSRAFRGRSVPVRQLARRRLRGLFPCVRGRREISISARRCSLHRGTRYRPCEPGHSGRWEAILAEARGGEA